MNILALDCGKHTGFGSLINGVVRTGTEHMKGKMNESAGMRYLKMDSWLSEMYEYGHYDLVAYEKPCRLQGNAIESMSNYIGCIHRFCAQREKSGLLFPEYRAVAPNEIKKWIKAQGVTPWHINGTRDYYERTLSPSAFKILRTKIPCIAWFEVVFGKQPVDSNESDGAALLYYICNELGIRL
jgi:hypothetical protein